MEAPAEEGRLLNKFKEMIKQVLEENGLRAKLKCFNREKGGDFQRKCNAPGKASHLH